jgi:hypothetical protein
MPWGLGLGLGLGSLRIEHQEFWLLHIRETGSGADLEAYVVFSALVASRASQVRLQSIR